MYDVNSLCVIPWTQGTGCSLATLMSHEEEGEAQLVMSHVCLLTDCFDAVVTVLAGPGMG